MKLKAMTPNGKVVRGYRPGPATYGYRWDDGILVEDPKEQSVLADIRSMRAEATPMSLAFIASWLNNHGDRQRCGRAWTRSRVWELIRDMRDAGMQVP